MKILNLVTIMSLLIVPPAFAGNEGGGGSVELMKARNKIVSLVDLVLVDIKYLKKEKFPFLKLKEFEIAKDIAKYEFTDEPLFAVVDGKKVLVDAKNYPNKMKIVFQKQRVVKLNRTELKALIFHEFLGLLSIDDSAYQHSRKYLAALMKEESSLISKKTSSGFELGHKIFPRAFSGDSSKLNEMSINAFSKAIVENMNGFENYRLNQLGSIDFWVSVPADSTSLTVEKVLTKAKFIMDPTLGYCKAFIPDETDVTEFRYSPDRMATRINLFEIFEGLREYNYVKKFIISPTSDPDCNDDNRIGAMQVEVEYYIWTSKK